MEREIMTIWFPGCLERFLGGQTLFRRSLEGFDSPRPTSYGRLRKGGGHDSKERK
jgi:hypothetical protein